jgi:hypothetical protein
MTPNPNVIKDLQFLMFNLTLNQGNSIKITKIPNGKNV